MICRSRNSLRVAQFHPSHKPKTAIKAIVNENFGAYPISHPDSSACIACLQPTSPTPHTTTIHEIPP